MPRLEPDPTGLASVAVPCSRPRDRRAAWRPTPAGHGVPRVLLPRRAFMRSRPSRAVASFLLCAAAILLPLLPGSPESHAAASCPPGGDARVVTPPEGAACGVASSPAAFSGVALPADMNEDDFVDIRDYGVWRQNFGLAGCGNPADVNGDCLVDIR